MKDSAESALILAFLSLILAHLNTSWMSIGLWTVGAVVWFVLGVVRWRGGR